MATGMSNMYEIEYFYKNMVYKVIGTLEEHEKLQNDHNFFNEYFKENYLNQEIVEIREDPVSENLETEKSFQWTTANTKLLLETYRQRVEDFRDPKIKKKKIWENIKKIFENKGLDVTVDALDRKMRNMKHTFKSIKDNNNKKTGRGRIQWQWYEAMDDIFVEDKTINIGHTLASTSKQESSAVIHVDIDNMEIDTSEENNLTKISQPSSLQSYNNDRTNQKIEKSRKARKARDLYDLRKTQIENEKKRVDAIQKLASAIEENNKIQLERNKLLSTLIELKRDKILQ